jgi:hypothetical protein
MIAINLLNPNYQYEVKRYKSVLYFEQDSDENKYYILEKSYEKENDIQEGYQYSYYKINGELYTGFWSNVYESFHKETEQMELFDRRNWF